MLPCRNRHSLARSAIFLPDIAVDINVPNLCRQKEAFCPLSLLSLISITAPSYFSRRCWESQAKNEFVAADLVMMCTMMRAGLLRFPPSLSLSHSTDFFISLLIASETRNGATRTR